MDMLGKIVQELDYNILIKTWCEWYEWFIHAIVVVTLN